MGGKLDQALVCYARALRLRPDFFRHAALNMASMGTGTLWLDSDRMRADLRALDE